MGIRGLQASEKRSPAPPQMNLDVGRLTILEAVHVGSLAVGALAVGAVGGLIAQAALPGRFETFASAGWFRLWFFLFGLAVALVGFGLACVVSWLSVRSWLSYEARLADWHDVSIAAYEGVDGASTETTITMWELSANNPLHVLGAALAVQARQSGSAGAPTVRSLQGDMWLPAPGGNMINLGEVNTTQAQRLSDVFSQLGLVEGKEPRKAGRWTADSADRVLELVAANWHKVRG